MHTVFIKTGVYNMFTNYVKNTNQPSSFLQSGISRRSAYLNLSYDLNNYHSLLTHISQHQDDRWILFIAPPGKPNVSFLQQAGIPKSRILTVAQSKSTSQTQLLKNALKSHNYATIISWLPDCDKALQNEINELANTADSYCFVYCAQ